MSLAVVGQYGSEVFLEPVRGFLMWEGGMCRMGGKGLIRRENAWVGLKVLLSASAGAW